MINHHPSHTVLQQFVEGTLPASVAVIVASHVEMCPHCQQLVHQLTELVAADVFDMEADSTGYYTTHGCAAETENLRQSEFEELMTDLATNSNPDDHSDVSSIFNDVNDAEMSTDSDMLAQMTSLPVEEPTTRPKTVTEIEVAGKRIPLPNAIKSLALKEWQGLGKISRARINLDDETRRTSLLHIDKGGSVPHHTHKGFEITLLLQGSFEDEMGTYQAGDFIWLSGEHTHNPVTQEGCVCLTVSSDALHFTQGVSQLFNPLGKLIY